MENPIKRFKKLYHNRREKEGQIAFLLYLAVIFTMIVNLIYGLFFLQVSISMFIINLVIFIYNIGLYILLEKDYKNITINLYFLQLWIFLVCSVLLIGWGYGYQQYIFAMICAFFLPFYMPETIKGNKYKIIGVLFTLTYFVLQILCYNFDFGIHESKLKMEIIFGINSFISMFIVMTFSALSTLFANETRKKLSRRADFDELTELYNRYALRQILENYKKENQNYKVAIVDIDFFKKVNDNYGHNVGDEVLKKVAKLFSTNINNEIDVGRWGGEEFLFIANSNIDYSEFKNILENIRK